jgi:hypothetical protein
MGVRYTLHNEFRREGEAAIVHQFCVELGKTPVQTKDLLKQTKCGRTVLRALIYPVTNDLQINVKLE